MLGLSGVLQVFLMTTSCQCILPVLLWHLGQLEGLDRAAKPILALCVNLSVQKGTYADRVGQAQMAFWPDSLGAGLPLGSVNSTCARYTHQEGPDPPG
jgi:hypothetical protein